MLKLKRTISRSGRGLVFRIPKDIQRMLGLEDGQQVNIWIENEKIIVEPIEKSD